MVKRIAQTGTQKKFRRSLRISVLPTRSPFVNRGVPRGEGFSLRNQAVRSRDNPRIAKVRLARTSENHGSGATHPPLCCAFVGMPSSVIRHFDYNPSSRELKLVFVTGRSYVYHDVPQAVANDMRHAISKGEFFNANIRDRYRFTRIDP